MTNSLDFHILPILQQEGQVHSTVPGLHVAQPPRRADRRRASEQLIFHLKLRGNASLSENAYQQLLKGLVGVYYKTPGAATSALQKVSEALNNYLRDRNMRGASRGLRAVGVFTQIVLRSDTAYIAQSGPSHLFVIKPGQAAEYHDPKMSGRGLGISRVPKVRLHQESLTENDLLLITPEPPPEWSTATLKNLSRMQKKSRYHRLLHRLEEDVNAILVMPQPGSGEVRILRPKLGDDKSARQVPAAGEEGPVRRGETSPEEGGPSPAERDGAGRDFPAPAESPPPARPRSPRGERSQPSPTTQPQRAAPVSSPPEEEQESRWAVFMERIHQLPVGMILRKIGTVLAAFGRAAGNALGGVRDGVVRVARRTLPDEDMLGFPAWGLGLIAVAVPIVMVVVGSVVYAEKKGSGYFNENLEQAKEMVEAAENAEDPAQEYEYWQAAVEALGEAHFYDSTDESEALDLQISQKLDVLDGVRRLVYEPLLDGKGLGEDVRISEIVIDSYGDLYLLDEISGSVFRLVSNNGYQVDEGFRCGPVPLGHIEVGPLVDIVPLAPGREDGAVILGIDEAHTMVLCTRAGGDTSIFTDDSYNLPKGGVRAMTISSSEPKDIFILAPDKELVLVEYQGEGYRTGEEYFLAGDSTPMMDAVDLAASGSTLFLLHEGGRITRCLKPGTTDAPVCDAPFNFNDTRPGRSSGPTFEGVDFSEMEYKTQYGKRMYLLDSEQQAVYFFSPDLAYLGQSRPLNPLLGGSATAFTVHMHEEIFLVVGGQVYRGEVGGGG